MMKHIIFKNKCENSNNRIIPFISLLVTIAVLAFTCAVVIYKFSKDKSYRIKWQDYDDCGIA